jgi:predicted Zn-dependent peptidase
LPHSTPRLPEALPLRCEKLPNGATLLICPLPDLHRVSLSVSFGTGSRDEPEALSGVSHLIEHLMFRGTPEYPSLRALSAAFEDIGGNINGFTSREQTSYETLLPPESLAEGVELLSQMVLSPRLLGLESERDIIREEILSDYDEDGRLINVDDLLMEELFEGPLGRAIAGTPESLARIGRGAVRQYYQSQYCGPNAVIALVGRIDLEDPVAVLAQAFDALRPSVPRHRDAFCALPSPKPRLHLRRYDGATQTELAFGVRTVGQDESSYPAVELALRILDDGLASRLPHRLIDELGLVYDVEAFSASTREAAMCELRLACRHRRVGRVLEELLGVLRRLADHLVSEEELERAKRRILWEHQALLDRPAPLAQWLTSIAHRGVLADPRQRCLRLLEVSAEAIREAAQQIFFGRAQRVVLVGELGPQALRRVAQRLGEGLGEDVELRAD